MSSKNNVLLNDFCCVDVNSYSRIFSWSYGFLFSLKMSANKKNYKMGHKFARPDIERLGIFSDNVDYTGGKYADPTFLKHKGYTFLTDNLKSKDASQKCYLDKKEFKRLFIGEALKGRGRKPPPKKPFISKNPFIRSDGPKLHATPGDIFGTFTDKVKAFSPILKSVKAIPKETKHNIITNNPKKGGPGYVNITIGPYPENYLSKRKVKPPPVYGKVLDGPVLAYLHPIDYFDKNPFKDPPNVKPGPYYNIPKEKVIPTRGVWACIGPNKLEAKEYFSVCKPPKRDPHITQLDAEKIWLKKTKKKNLAGPYSPQSMGLKTLFTTSIINRNLYKINTSNYQTAEPKFTKRLMC